MVNKITNQKSFIVNITNRKFIDNTIEIIEGIDSEVNNWIGTQSKKYEEFEVKDIKQQTVPISTHMTSIIITVIYTYSRKKADM